MTPDTAVLTDIARCNRCGFCLPACPTYHLTGEERHSPRGRIALVEALVRGEVAAGPLLADALDRCLGCRACESACPSGVAYHRIRQAGQDRLRRAWPPARRLPFLPRQALRLVRRPRRLARALSLAARLRRLPWPPGWRRYAPMLGYRPQALPPLPDPGPGARPAAFFTGCVQEAMFADANRAAEALLTAAGYRVQRPEGQGCCGALALHAGRVEEAQSLARANLDAFAGTEGPVVNTAGGCGAMLAEYGELLAGDPAYAARARAFATRVRDWATLLREAPPLPFRGEGRRVTLQNSCHLVHVEGAGADPPAL
ncbi:MAG: (Fe-S)-binding protein, partial [Firmicutes bacterium]|nr:(Fe-S)-binding protein [Bacillota bacterium]